MKDKIDNALKMISLNIEFDRHFDLILPFLKKQKPDVILLQEVLDKDLTFLEKELAMKSEFVPLAYRQQDNGQYELGLATFTSLAVQKVNTLQFENSHYYKGQAHNLPILRPGIAEIMPRALLITRLMKEENDFCFVNTHFTWSPDGKPSAYQFQDLEVMLDYLQTIESFVLCGDFNAPRGTKIFDTIASYYKDNVPKHITTTIDKNLHKAGDLNLMVDGLFTTPDYQALFVEVVDGVSDHCAIMAVIRKDIGVKAGQ